MKIKAIVLGATGIGAIIGYLILSPAAMVISDYAHHTNMIDFSAHEKHSLTHSLIEPFTGEFIGWALAHSVMGAMFGLMLGIFLTIYLKYKTKVFENYSQSINDWIDREDKFKKEINELLKNQGQPPKY